MNTADEPTVPVELQLRNALQRVAARQRSLTFWCALGACWLLAAALGLVLLWAQRTIGWGSALVLPGVALLAIVAAIFVTLRLGRREASLRQIAQRLEEAYRELDGCVLTAAQQQARAGEALNYLQRRVVEQALRHSQVQDWTLTIPVHRVALAQTGHWLSLILFCFVLWGLRTTGGNKLLARIAESGVTVSPGDTSLERGSSLVVMVRFGDGSPAAVNLVIGQQRIPLIKSLSDPVFGASVPDLSTNLTYAIEYSGRRTRDFKVEVFEYPRLERADVDLKFPEYTGQQPKRIEDTRRLSAVEGSSLDLDLQFNKPVASARFVSKDQKTVIPLVVESNRPAATLKQFALQATSTYELQLLDSDGRTNKVPARFVFNVLKNQKPELRLALPRGDTRPSPLQEIVFEGTVWDDFGIKTYGLGYTVAGKEPTLIELGQQVASNEKKSFQHVLRLEELGLNPDELVAWFVWAEDIGPDNAARRSAGDLFFGEIRPFEEIFREQADGGGGESPGGGQQNSRTARLAELQKQIINATWNLQREHSSSAVPGSVTPGRSRNDSPAGPSRPLRQSQRFTPPSTSMKTLFGAVSDRVIAQRSERTAPTSPGPRARNNPTNSTKASVPSLPADAGVVRDSQATALEQVKEQLDNQDDPRIAELWNAAALEMQKALDKLSASTNSPALLQEAILAEQAAYQALLRLQQHEYEVSRRRQRNQSGGGGSREQQMQMQLEQMDLTQDEDRYENQRRAQPQQSAERREELQVLNRLAELARRQQDLNERLKELQAALQEAKTEEERQEIRRRLKRLQEEERQMLADVDELRQRMDQPENQSRMADERRQLDQTREDVQRAAEAAAEGSPSQALASGTRAQRQLQEMRDQMRKETSSRFADDLRQMRGEARELARQQEEIVKRLQTDLPKEQKTLSDSPQREQLLDQLAQQKQRTTNLVDQAAQVSQEAEETEPLLSRKLYDSLRKFNQDNSANVKQTRDELLERGLLTSSLNERLKENSEQDAAKLFDVASEMLRQDFLPPARQAGARSQAAIDELKRGVEQAAESVLGDDTEALRFAQSQLDDVMDQLQREMAQAQGGGQTNRGQLRSEGTNTSANAEGALAQGESNRQPNNPDAARTNTEASQPGASPGQTPGSAEERQAETAARDSESGQQANSSGAERSNAARAGEQQAPGSNQNRSPGQEASPAESANDQQGETAGTGRGNQRSAERPQRDGRTASSGQRNGFNTDGGGGGGGTRGGFLNDWERFLNDGDGMRGGPITGEEFGPWSDRLREVEELVDLPEWRNEVATARERARLMRQDYKREGKTPDWAVVRLQVLKPLVEVRDHITEELARRQSDDKLVPIDRDPVPNRYSDLVRKYYEELGKER